MSEKTRLPPLAAGLRYFISQLNIVFMNRRCILGKDQNMIFTQNHHRFKKKRNREAHMCYNNIHAIVDDKSE